MPHHFGYNAAEQRDVTAILTAVGLEGHRVAGSRDVSWPWLCCKLADKYEEMMVGRRKSLMNDMRQWKMYNAAFVEDLPITLLRLKFARERWARDTYSELATQHQCWEAVTLAGVLSGLLSEEALPCSTIYVGLNLRSSRKYFGLVEDRNPLLRFKEHWAAIDDHHRGTEATTDWKYNYMARQGGAAAWIFLPLISLPVVIPHHRLRTLEKLLIARNPTSVNCENRRRFANTLPRKQAGRRVSRPWSEQETYTPRSVATIIPQVWSSHPGDAGPIPSCDLLEAIGSGASMISVHTSYPWSLTGVRRRWGQSTVTAVSDLGATFAGTLAGMVNILDSPGGDPQWWFIHFENRLQQKHSRPEDYQYLLACCRGELDASELDELTVEDYWKMCAISRRDVLPTAPAMHRKTIRVVTKQLRRCGIMVHPEKPVRMRLPRCLGVSQREVRATLARALRTTYLPLCVCDHILRTLKVTWEGPEKVGSALDTGHKLAEKLAKGGTAVCGCANFPHLPRRHGHVFCPSWEYTGPHQETVRVAMSSHIPDEPDEEGLLAELRLLWLRCLPTWSVPFFFVLNKTKEDWRRKATGSAYSARAVRRTKKFLAPLVVTAVDKCAQGLLLQCPLLYEEKYKTTFCEELDPVHFSKEFDEVDECLECMKSEYDGAVWKKLGRWDHKGTIACHYILPKYKDIVATCEEVQAKKGTCCRVRPILPYTTHPLRKPFKRGGAALGFIVDNLPDDQFAVKKTSEVRNKLHEWNSAAQCRYGDDFEWIVWVGDISNMYDELDPSAAVAAVKKAIGQIHVWAGRRKVTHVNVPLRGKGEVRWGRSSDESRVDVELNALLAMVEYDCYHTYYCSGGGVNRRKFGVPMGGLMSPFLAILTCSIMAEFDAMSCFPADMIGGCMRYMDDVLGVMAVSNDYEKARARWWFHKVQQCYPPPLKLCVEPEDRETRFLELVVITDGPNISCRLFNKCNAALRTQTLFVPRLPGLTSGTSVHTRRGLVTGFVYRAIQGCTDLTGLVVSLAEFSTELRLQGWGCRLLCRAIQQALNSEKEFGDVEKEMLLHLSRVLPDQSR